jgi:hypothetical protein
MRKLSWRVTSLYGMPRGVAASVKRTVAPDRPLVCTMAVQPFPSFSSQMKSGHADAGTSTRRPAQRCGSSGEASGVIVGWVAGVSNASSASERDECTTLSCYAWADAADRETRRRRRID